MYRYVLLFVLQVMLFSIFSQQTNPFIMKNSTLTNTQLDSIYKKVERAGKIMDKMTLEQEYYLGRAVAAAILSSYDVLDDIDANTYINKIGIALSLFSEKPQIFGGYHFLILDTDEINAFATPSGHIFVSKGMLRLTDDEDEIAAILAHEISHIVLNHGVLAINKSKITTFYDSVVVDAVKDLTSPEFKQLTKFFEDSIMDVTTTFINTGYSKKYEFAADAGAISIMKKTNYDPHALIRVLSKIKAGFKTHPAPLERANSIKRLTGISGYGTITSPSLRYKKFMEKL